MYADFPILGHYIKSNSYLFFYKILLFLEPKIVAYLIYSCYRLYLINIILSSLYLLWHNFNISCSLMNITFLLLIFFKNNRTDTNSWIYKILVSLSSFLDEKNLIIIKILKFFKHWWRWPIILMLLTWRYPSKQTINTCTTWKLFSPYCNILSFTIF